MRNKIRRKQCGLFFCQHLQGMVVGWHIVQIIKVFLGNEDVRDNSVFRCQELAQAIVFCLYHVFDDRKAGFCIGCGKGLHSAGRMFQDAGIF